MPSFASQFSKLQHITGYEELNLDDGYKIVPAVHGSWKDCGRRILFIVESMDSADIRHGRMFTSVLGKRDEETNLMVPTMRNLIQHSWELYQEYEGINTLVDTIPTPDDTAIGFVNFNAVKYFHLRDAPRRNAMIACAKRVIQIVERMKPTDVVIFGDAAAYFVMPGAEDREHLRYKRGWTEGRLIGKHRCKVTTTLDIEPLYKEKSGDDEDDAGADDSTSNADLLYYVSRHLMNAFAGRHLHSLRDLKAKPVMVDTIEKFDKLWQKLWDTEDPIGFDSETETLESVHNKIYCHQYALSPDRGYIIPIDHPTSPFTEDERDYIKAKLRKLWAARNPARKKTFVGVNLAFDVRVIRAQFDIPVIYHTLWDIPAGELMLDENISLFNTLAFRVDDGSAEKITAGNLRAILTSYGNDFYYTASFSKEERSTIGHVDLMTHTACQEYCAMDCQSPLAMRLMQLERARHIRITPKRNYEAVYERHVSNQMSNTVHSISHMHQAGSHVDVPYLEYLLGDDSPLLKVRRASTKELMTMPAVQEANAGLLKTRGIKEQGLFSKAIQAFDIGKPESLIHLFIDTLGLKPLRTTTTGQPSIDKKFLAEYAPYCREAELVADYRVAMKLYGTYVKGWLKEIKEHLDSAKDLCLRPSFGFFIVTGRLNSFKPNLQQVPSRGKTAKIIKQAFIPRKGRLNFNWDFNAAEVRQAAVLSGDTALAEAFMIGTRLRQEFIATTDPERKKELTKRLKTEGDVHIANVKKFFGFWVDKNHPLRQAIKNVVFGALYGLSVKSLARDLEMEARYRHRDAILKIEKEIKATKRILKEIEAGASNMQEEEEYA